MNAAPTNLLLAKLPDSERRALLQLLEPVALPLRHSLYTPDAEPVYVHFLTSGMASIVTNMVDGGISEGGLVGREGMPESLHLLGPGLVPTNCFMQIGGTGLRMKFREFQEQMLYRQVLRRGLMAFIQYQSLVLGQVAACNRLHGIESRLARWLLMVDDRTDEKELPLAQQFLSQMLGAQRSTITLAAGKLQELGIIDYTRGHVRIRDRDQLQLLACECYKITDGMLQRFYNLNLQNGWGASYVDR